MIPCQVRHARRVSLNMFKKLILFDCHVCPWWLAYTFDNRLRRLFHSPEKLVGPYVEQGMTVMDIGCGMGYFSIGLARLVGDKGLVIAVDIQENMLNVMRRRAEKAGVAHLIHLHRCEQDKIGIDWKVDFALAFWMTHEVPHKRELFEELFHILVPKGQFLLAEPKLHVSVAHFQEILEACTLTGFKHIGNPKISLSRSALLRRP